MSSIDWPATRGATGCLACRATTSSIGTRDTEMTSISSRSLRGAARCEARDGDAPAREAQRVPIEAVRAVAERDPAFGVAPRELSAGAVVPERQRRAGLAEAAIRAVLVASHDDAEGAVRALPEPEIGHLPGPDLAR